jgi:hypothetical protein
MSRKSKAHSILNMTPVVKQHGIELAVVNYEEVDGGVVNFVMEVMSLY